MLKYAKRTLRDMAFGAVITASILSYVAAPHIDWTLHAGNQPDLLVHTKEQAVAQSQLAMPEPKPRVK